MKKTLLLFTLLFLVVGVPQLWADGQTLYVVPPASCANNGNGLAATCAASVGATGAFRTSDNILCSLTDDATKLDPGDILYVLDTFLGATNGVFFYGGTADTELCSGTASKRIQVRFDYPGRPGIIDGRLSGNYGFVSYRNFYDLYYPVVYGGTINALSITTFSGVSTLSKNVRIYGGEVAHNAVSGQKCMALRGQDILVDGTTVHDCYDDGVWMTGKRITVFRTNVYDISNGSILGDCLQTSGDMDGTEWGWNYCDHSNVDSKYCGVLTTDSDGGTVWVHDNVCLRRSTDVLGDGFRSDTNTIFERNVVTGGTYGIHCNQVITEFCRVLGNVFIGQSLAGVRTEEGTVDVAYNTIVDQAIVGHRMVGTAATQRSYNNLFVNSPTGIKKDTNNTPLDFNNLFYLTTNTLLVNVTPTTPGTGSLLATNPLFVGSTYADAAGRLNGGARTRGTSPARNAARASGLCTDIRARGCNPSSHDMGAYQATSGDPAPARTAR